MSGGDLRLASDERGARGDALIGERGALGVVGRKIGIIKSRAGELPRVGRIIFVRLELDLGALEFLFGERGGNLCLLLAGEHDSGGEDKNSSGVFPSHSAGRR